MSSTDADSMFEIKEAGDYMIQLTVDDETGLTSICQQSFKISSDIPQPPVVIIEASHPDATYKAGELIVLNGTNSYDPNGDLDKNSFFWSCSVGLAEKNNGIWSFTIDKPGLYVINLTVSDEKGNRTSKDIIVDIVE